MLENFQLSDFHFEVPKDLIAKHPTVNRDESKLLVLDENLYEARFREVENFIDKDDLIVFNNTKVLKSKLVLSIGVDLYFYQEISISKWLCFAKPSRKIREGDEFKFGENKIDIHKNLGLGKFEVVFYLEKITVFQFFNKYGCIPLPPYIKRNVLKEDCDRYQSVFAKVQGSVAAPTASLHFTKSILANLEQKGVEIDYVTLHVGAGTFLPIKEDIDSHIMHSEKVYVSEELKRKVIHKRSIGKKVVSVGTTVLRALESSFLYQRSGHFHTDIFIKPGFKFKSSTALLTNFHLPKSTLIILVCAFGGYHKVMSAYKLALFNRYRFFSYGDAMLLPLNGLSL